MVNDRLTMGRAPQGKDSAHVSAPGEILSGHLATGIRPTEAQRRYLERGLTQAGGKLPLFDRDGREVSKKTIESCVAHGWAAPWVHNPIKPDWLVCRLTAAGYRVLGGQPPSGPASAGDAPRARPLGVVAAASAAGGGVVGGVVGRAMDGGRHLAGAGVSGYRTPALRRSLNCPADRMPKITYIDHEGTARTVEGELGSTVMETA